MSQLPLNIGLRDSPSFDNFYGEERREAVTIMRSVLAGAGTGHVIYLHGPGGAGKTHLLAAAVRHAHEEGRGFFAASLAEPGQARPELLEGLGESGLVCIDDVDIGLGELAWEEALFDVYLRMEACSSPLLIASRVGPFATKPALPDLASRLRGAIAIRLSPLSEASVRLVLAARARDRGFVLGDDVLEYLLRRGRRDMHALMAYLDRLDTTSLAEKRRITVPLMRDILVGTETIV